MSDKKYKIRDDYRIVALKKGPWGEIGTVGGCCFNGGLSHEGDCWLYDHSQMHDRSQMHDDSEMRGYSQMHDDSQMHDRSQMRGYSEMHDDSQMHDRSQMRGYSQMHDDSQMRGYSQMHNDSSTHKKSRICGNLRMFGGSIYSGSHEDGGIFSLGHTDGYSKCVCKVDGVAWVGAGCRWFTLKDAIEHWENHTEDRTLTLISLHSARAWADHHKLSYGE